MHQCTVLYFINLHVNTFHVYSQCGQRHRCWIYPDFITESSQLFLVTHISSFTLTARETYLYVQQGRRCPMYWIINLYIYIYNTVQNLYLQDFCVYVQYTFCPSPPLCTPISRGFYSWVFASGVFLPCSITRRLSTQAESCSVAIWCTCMLLVWCVCNRRLSMS